MSDLLETIEVLRRSEAAVASRYIASQAEIERLRTALEKIACHHVTEQPLWWQIEARSALSKAEGQS